MDLLTLRSVEVGYHRRRILPAVDLTVRRGTFLGIVGPNASGKTTLVRTMLHLIPPVAGMIHYPAGRAPRFGYVPQRAESERSFPLTVLDLVMMARTPRRGLLRRLGADDRKAASAALARVGLANLEARPLHTLSGGQRQRALIARALAAEPDVLILDEPTTGMDIVAEASLLELVESLRQQLDLGVVMVSHHLGLVASYVAEVLLVDRERGAVEHGATEEVVTSARLSRLYGVPITVREVSGRRMVHVDDSTPAAGAYRDADEVGS